MDIQIKTLLKLYVENKKYDKCYNILYNEIKNQFISKVSLKNSNYNYTLLLNLMDNVKKYLSPYEIYLFKEFYNTINFDYTPQIQVALLLDIYNKLNEYTK